MLRMTLLSNAVNQRLCVWVDAYLKECCISLTLEKEALFIGARGPLIPWEGLRTPEPFLIKGGERMVVFPITQIQKLQEQSFHWAKAEMWRCRQSSCGGRPELLKIKECWGTLDESSCHTLDLLKAPWEGAWILSRVGILTHAKMPNGFVGPWQTRGLSRRSLEDKLPSGQERKLNEPDSAAGVALSSKSLRGDG